MNLIRGVLTGAENKATIIMSDSGDANANGTYHQITPEEANALTVAEGLGWTWAFATEDNLRIYGYNGADGGVSVYINSEPNWISVYRADYEEVDPGVIIDPTWDWGTEPYPTMSWANTLLDTYGLVQSIEFNGEADEDTAKNKHGVTVYHDVFDTKAAVEATVRFDRDATLPTTGTLINLTDTPNGKFDGFHRLQSPPAITEESETGPVCRLSLRRFTEGEIPTGA